jgi:hypothetical protein
MMKDHSAFLSYVQGYVKEHPDVSAYVSDHVAQGVNASRLDVMERAADMEVALTVAIANRYKGRDELILSKLKKWKDRSAIRWDDTISMLEGRVG